jgi:ABC-type branched-subunit amino acid transport system substrate-binding protein
MKRGKIISLLGICLVLVLATAILDGARPALSAEKELKIGVAIPLTGPCADIGAHAKRGITLATDEINAAGGVLGRKIKLFFADDKSTPAVGIAAAERLITKDKVDVLMGTYNSSVALAVMEVPAKYGVPFITGGATSDQIGLKRASDTKKYRAFYKPVVPSYMYGKVWIWFWEEMLDRGLYKPESKNVAMVYENSAWGIAITDAIKKYLKESKMYKEGYRIVLADQVPIGETDFLAEISKVKAHKPGIAFGIFASVPSNSAFQKQFVSAGIKVPVCSTYTPNNPEFITLTGPAANGLVWCSVICLLPTKEAEHFEKAIWEKYKKKVEVVGSIVYDDIYMIKEAYERAGSFDREKFLEAMDKTRHVGAAGVYEFDPVTHEGIPGEFHIPPVVYQIQDGKSIGIWPKKYAEAKYTVPSWMK